MKQKEQWVCSLVESSLGSDTIVSSNEFPSIFKPCFTIFIYEKPYVSHIFVTINDKTIDSEARLPGLKP